MSGEEEEKEYDEGRGDGEQQGLLSRRCANEADSTTYLELDEFEDGLPRYTAPLPQRSRRSRWFHLRGSSVYCSRRSTIFRILQGFVIVLCLVFCLITLCGVFFPSYSHPPQRYQALRTQVERANHESRKGSANVFEEKVFIAASLFDPDGELVSGDWGRTILRLINILGPSNVYLSIYENNADPVSRAALEEFKESLSCNSSVVVEDLDLSQLPHVRTADGRQRLKRMVFLAEVRNRALKPLQDTATRFDRLLYVNDVIFDPIDAANLLFSTNADEAGKAHYHAACAMDFINSVKFYDNFAARDMEGHDMGVPFYPWFTSSGDMVSRRDVLAQKDAVKVKSCWGGMVAFEARWFQPLMYTDSTSSESKEAAQDPLAFRAEQELYWDASECCLIHADLMEMANDTATGDWGIFMNPYVRVAYSGAVLNWLSFTKRFERLYPPIQNAVNIIAGRPSFNPRRLEQAGDEVVNRVWTWNAGSRNQSLGQPLKEVTGSYEDVKRISLPGPFCGTRLLYSINENPKPGEKQWISEPVPTD